MLKKLNKLFNNQYLVVGLLLVIGLTLRLYKIDEPLADWHSFRQADTASVAREFVNNGINMLYPRYHDISTTQSGIFNPNGYRFVEFPLYNSIHAFVVTNVGMFSLEVWGRLLSIMFSLISLLLVFYLGKRFIGLSGGYLAAFLFATMPFNIYFSRVILPEPLAVTLALVGLSSMVKYYDDRSATYLFIASIFYALGLLIKPNTFFYLFPSFYLVLKDSSLKSVLKNWRYWFFGAIIIIPFASWRWWINHYPEGIPFWKWIFNGDDIRFRPAFWKWIFGERFGYLMLGIWGLIPFTYSLIKKDNNNFIKWLFVGSVIYVVLFATASVRHDYYQVVTVPAFVLGVSSGFVYLWNNKNYSKFVTKGLLIFSIFMMLLIPFYPVREYYQINRPEIIVAGKAVDSKVPSDALVIAPYNGDTAFLYQTNRHGWPVVDRPINELVDKGADYFVSVDLNHWQTIEFEKKYLTLEKTDQYIILDLNKQLE